MNKYLLFILGLIFCSNFGYSQNADSVLKKSKSDFFIENKGQWLPEVKYLARVNGLNAWITDFGVVYDYHKIIPDSTKTKSKSLPDKFSKPDENSRIKGQVIKMTFLNPQPPESKNPKEVLPAHIETGDKAKYEGTGKNEGYYNYFIGNDSTKWASFVGLYDEAYVKDIYKGIDVRYYYNRSSKGNLNLRYDFIINPGADLSQIKIKIEGADSYDVNDNGELVIQTSIGEIKHNKLYTYQVDEDFDFSTINQETQNILTKENKKITQVQCRFVKNPDGTISFKADNYDHTKKLVIDPLVYSTYIGAYSYEYCNSLAIDNSGNAYIAGSTNSSDYPTTSNAYDREMNGYYYDVFVTKLNNYGSSLVFSTFLGGGGDDGGNSISLNSNDYIFITGWTTSNNFPTTEGSYETTYNGRNIFVTKLDSSGSELIYSTYLGGNSTDDSHSIKLDNNNAVLSGRTASTNYPTTSGSYDQYYNGGYYDIFVTKLNSEGSDLIYSTLLGGSGQEDCHSIALDSSSNIYLTGYTCSNDFPTTSYAYDTNFLGSVNVFVTKLDSSCSFLNFSTFIGSPDSIGCEAYSLVLDDSSNVYLTGLTASSNYPVTTGAYDESYNGGICDIFLTKLANNASIIRFSTYLGGEYDETGMTMVRDKSGNIFLSGETGSYNFPTTDRCFNENYTGGVMDLFISLLNPSGSTLLYSTYIGGSSDDHLCNSMCVDSINDVFIAGRSLSYNYPTTAGSFCRGNYGSGDNFISKLSIIGKPILISPLNNSPYRNINPLVKWHKVINAQTYTLQLSTSNSFNSFLLNQIITDTSYVLNGLNNNSQYFWRVQANGQNDTSSWSQIWNFTYHYLSEPNLIFPLNNSTNVSLSALLKWNSVINSSYYQLQISPSSNFNELKINQNLNDTIFNLSGLLFNNQYFWRVRAINLTDTSYWSDVWKFTTINVWNYSSSSGNYATIVVPSSIEPMMGNRQFMTGDAIGVFYSDSGILKCAGYGVWNGNDMGFTIWGDDTTTLQKDGFYIDENFTFRVWDGQLGIEHPAEVTYSYGPSTFQIYGFSILGSLTVNLDTISIPLNNGWNMISSWISPYNTNLSSVMSPIADNLSIMKDGRGNFYVPIFNINLIGSWNIFNGYQVYMAALDTLPISGLVLNPQSTTIYMNQGWNMKAYLRSSPMSAVTALSEISNNLIIVKDGAGRFYVPSLNVNTIGNMQPGLGYQFYISNTSESLTYPANGSGRIAHFDEITPQAKLLKPIVENTGNNASLFIKFKNGFNGDEIGVYNSKDMLIGSGRIDNILAGITIWGRNENSKVGNGAYSGEKLSVKILNQKSGILEELPLSNLQEITHLGNISGLNYLPDGIYFANAAINNEITNELTLNVYPNPALETYFVEFNSPESNTALLELYTLEGNLIWRKNINDANKYFNKLEFDVRDNVDGVYQLLLKNGSQIVSKRIVILK